MRTQSGRYRRRALALACVPQGATTRGPKVAAAAQAQALQQVNINHTESLELVRHLLRVVRGSACTGAMGVCADAQRVQSHGARCARPEAASTRM